ncbi:MAG: acyl-CoA thioesterase [Flavobacteriales bacterium]
MNNYSPEIRFADIDAMGHVNNAVYFSYFEQARIHTFRQLVGLHWDWNADGLLVARNEIDYKRPLFLNDQVEIVTRCTVIGQKSFTITYQVNRGDELCASGTSVLVCYNHREHHTQQVPQAWRDALAAIM